MFCYPGALIRRYAAGTFLGAYQSFCMQEINQEMIENNSYSDYPVSAVNKM